jgi:Holliday junction resolvase-like predicted endonuclease
MKQDTIMIRKADGGLEKFDLQKLEHSLARAHASPEVAQKVVAHMVQNVEDGMTTHEIYHQAFSFLHSLETPVAARYSLRRAIMELGPSGFPFERFVAEILKTQGYEAITDQVVQGECVEHEVDVVAWNDKELIMTEVKFHNELGLKSDLKVVLYVKARFEDLEQSTFNDYGGQNRKMTDGWLVTNTKFTLSAIKYAECKKMKIIGWNYPIDNGLKDMIEKSGLHPITSLNALSVHDKKALLEQNIVLCKTIANDKEVLRSIGLTDANIESVLEEISLIDQPYQEKV